MKIGTIILVKFPFTDLTDFKFRAAMILSNISIINDFIISFISSQIKVYDEKTDLIINPKEQTESGLKTISVLKLSKIMTLNSSLFYGEIGNIDDNFLLIIKKKLKVIFEL